MNNINFIQDGGLPLSTNLFDWLQEKIDTLQILSEIKGGTPINNNGFVISGCNVSGNNVESGYIYAKYDGGDAEIFKFNGGNKTTNPYIELLETKTELLFEDGICRDVLFVRELKLTTTNTGFPFSNVKLLSDIPTNETLSNLLNNLNDEVEVLKNQPQFKIPSGLIVMWSGALQTIPNGWLLCDGTNGTPNLIDKFIMGGGGSKNIGSVGGQESILLNVSNLPKHRHNVATNKSGTTSIPDLVASPNSEITYKRTVSNNTADYTFKASPTNPTGGSIGVSGADIIRDGGDVLVSRTKVDTQTSVTVLPPYYVLAYIMKE
jgi:microcystin-dependent protein